MRIRVNIDEKIFHQIKQETQLEKTSPAINKALSEFLENRRRQRIITSFFNGQADYSSTNDDLEKTDIYDIR